MNKDIIYIDTEDDITSIIGKIKASNEKIVALVPPKRVGMLQSAVNLRLLARTAKNNDKHLVLITNNKALIALSAPAKIPVAKNLQSKPEIAEIAALDIDDGEDIIEGKQLPVGELVKTVDHSLDADVANDISSIDIDGEGPQAIDLSPETPVKSVNKSSGIKVPDFIKFRKKLFLIGGGVFLFVMFLIWAIWIAPSATVIITAKTESAPVSATLKLGSSTDETNVNNNLIQTVTKQIKKDISVDFTATGQKDLGGKASGSITVRNCDYTSGFSIPVGSQFTNGAGQVYVSTESKFVPAFTSPSSSSCSLSGSSSGKATIPVQASASGDTYNSSADSYNVGAVASGSKVDAQGTAMTGGSTRMATVVTADDISKATQALNDLSTSDIKKQLISQFNNGEKVIDVSFNADHGTITSTPAVDTEASSGKAKLTSNTTFSMTGIAKSELDAYLNNSINKQIDNNSSQRIYDNGFSKATFSNYQKGDKGVTVALSATGQIGPNIDKDAIKKQVKGKNFGEVQSLLEGVKGVSNVDVKFSYFWVNTVPNDTNKIDIQFAISNA